MGATREEKEESKAMTDPNPATQRIFDNLRAAYFDNVPDDWRTFRMGMVMGEAHARLQLGAPLIGMTIRDHYLEYVTQLAAVYGMNLLVQPSEDGLGSTIVDQTLP